MQKLTHCFSSMGLSVMIFSFFVDSTSLLIIASISFMLGGINDWLDFALFKMFEHRNWLTHSLLSPILISGIIMIIVSVIFSWFWGLTTFFIFSISWIIHVLLDSLTFTGVYLFIPGHSVSGKIHYKNVKWNSIFIGISIILSFLGYLVSHFWV